MDKIAVDSTAASYWSKYFKDYGKMWVRDIPKRIKAAMKHEAKLDNIDGNVVPLASHTNDDKSLSIEAAFVGKVDNIDANYLITAEFKDDGQMKNIEINRVK